MVEFLSLIMAPTLLFGVGAKNHVRGESERVACSVIQTVEKYQNLYEWNRTENDFDIRLFSILEII